jgi:hypothetical protein
MRNRLGYKKRPRKKGRWVPPRGSDIKKPKLTEPGVETSFGLKVRSNYEKETAEYFVQNNIEFQYEPLILLHGRQFRPDFYLPKHNLFIEICGYNHMPHYRLRIAKKKQLYSKYGLNSVFIDYDGKGSLSKLIAESLHEYISKIG